MNDSEATGPGIKELV